MPFWNGEHFQKKGESSSLSISEIIDSKRGGYLLSEHFVINLLTGEHALISRHYYYIFQNRKSLPFLKY